MEYAPEKYNAVVWFEIYVDDLKRAQQFYEKVLNVKLDAVDMPEDEQGQPALQMLMFPGGPDKFGASGSLVKMDGVKAGGGNTLVYFSSVDCAVEAGRIEAAGGKVFRQKFSIGEYGFAALGVDTEGNMFGIHSMR